MKYRCIVCQKREGIVRLILNRPDSCNSIDSVMAAELCDACQEIGDAEDVRALIITGAGGPFSLGVAATQGPGSMELLQQVASAVEAVARLELPVIAAVNGPALAEGLELALACDVRIASQGAQFGLPQIRQGRIPTCGGTQRLPRIIGKGKALEMILTGDSIGADDAYRVGLVNRLVATDSLLATAEELAAMMVRNAPIAARYAKEAILRGLDRPLDQGMRLEADLSVLLQTTDDRAEGLDSFLKRRLPEYKGK